jgi:hypothetical protein
MPRTVAEIEADLAAAKAQAVEVEKTVTKLLFELENARRYRSPAQIADALAKACVKLNINSPDGYPISIRDFLYRGMSDTDGTALRESVARMIFRGITEFQKYQPDVVLREKLQELFQLTTYNTQRKAWARNDIADFNADRVLSELYAMVNPPEPPVTTESTDTKENIE